MPPYTSPCVGSDETEESAQLVAGRSGLIRGFLSVLSGQRGASDAEDEDEHPERLSAQVRLQTQTPAGLFVFF